MSPAPFKNAALRLVVTFAVAVACCSAAQAQDAEAIYNPSTGEITINVFANNIATLSIVAQTGQAGMPGFLNFMSARGDTGLGAPLNDANEQFVNYNRGLNNSGNQITFTPGSYNIGAVFDPNLSFTYDPGASDLSEVSDSGGASIGLAALDIDTQTFVPIQTQLQVVPEPGALPLLAMGIVAMFSRRRR